MPSSLPQGLKQTLPVHLQHEWDSLLAVHQAASVNSVRLNPKKPSERFASAEQIPWCTQGRYLAERPSFTFDPLFHAGAYYVQEASSMFLAYALLQHCNFDKDLSVLDLCAAPGGKSTHIASLISDDSILISNEVIGSRVNILAENLLKWGYDNTWVSHSDPVRFGAIPDFFDLLLIDAPCSGSGLFRKMPAYCEEWSPELVSHCALRQQRIVNEAYPALAQNGLMVYMTCSLSQAENEDMLDYLCDSFSLASCRVQLNHAHGIIETQSERKQAWGYRLSPQHLKGEGFFLAVLRKQDGREKAPLKQSSLKRWKGQDLSAYIDTSDKFLFQQNDSLLCIRKSHQDTLDFLSSKIKLTRKGVMLGRILPRDILPDHALALYTGCKYHQLTVELNYEQAIAYLRKENLSLSLTQKGWYLVRYQGLALGWLKNLGNRINNYYPSNYRILSQNILQF